jgi:urease accessory protein UreF
MNTSQKPVGQTEGEAMLGDFRALARALGRPDGAAGIPGAGVDGLGWNADAAGLRGFLAGYRGGLLRRVELPSIQEAYGLATRRAIREVLELDARTFRSGFGPEMAEASRRIGRRHLAAMRPLRDERIIQRYLREVEAGRAGGWHTVVYGIFLALYSVPLRQGLLNYARQTQQGFVLGAIGRGQVTEEEGGVILGEIEGELPGVLQGLAGLEPRLALLLA